MGVFLNLMIVPGRSRERVQAAFQQVDWRGEEQYHLTPDRFQWTEREQGTLVLLEDCHPYEGLPQALSRQMEHTAMLCYIYDDDFWGYDLYHRGEWIDTFWTVPDCFQPEDPRLSLHSPRQRAELLGRYLSADPGAVLNYLTPWTREELDGEGLLAYPDDAAARGDCWQLGDFLRRLGNWTEGVLDPPVPGTPAEPPQNPGRKSREEQSNRPDTTRPLEAAWEGTDISRCLPRLAVVRLVEAPKKGLFALLQGRKAPRVEELDGAGLDGAALERLLERFYAGELAQLELDFTIQGKGVYVKRLKKMVSQPCRLTVELVQEAGRYVCVCFDDQALYVYWLIADREVYFHEDCKEHRTTTLAGRPIECYLVHSGPQRVREEVPLLLSNLGRQKEVFDCIARMGVWSNEYHYRNKKKHQELRRQWCLGIEDM